MSFEGFDQLLCDNGHLREFDIYLAPDLNNEGNRCPNCAAVFVWRHTVDETNGYVLDDPSTHRHPLEVATEQETKQCNLGHSHVTVEATYKIP